MNATEFKKLTSLMTTATPEQLCSVVMVANGLLKLQGKSPVKVNTPAAPPPIKGEADWLYIGIVAALRRHGLPVVRSRSLGGAVKMYELARPTILEWFDEAVPKLKPVERMQLGTVAARCLYLRLKSMGGDVSLKRMLESSSQIPQAIEAQFPGYAASGLLGLVLHRSATD